jgi:hypothetical protein
MDIATTSVPRSAQGKRRFWQNHLEAQRRSGLSIVRYCREQGLARSAFGYWQRTLASSLASNLPGPAPVTIVPVPLASLRQAEPPPTQQPSSPLRLTVAGRFRIEIGGDFSAPILEKLVATLERLA